VIKLRRRRASVNQAAYVGTGQRRWRWSEAGKVTAGRKQRQPTAGFMTNVNRGMTVSYTRDQQRPLQTLTDYRSTILRPDSR